MDSIRNRIDGDGFSQDDLSPEERAKMRALIHDYEREAIRADNALRHPPLQPLAPVATIAKALPIMAGVAAGMMAMGAAARWLHDAGLF